MKKIISFLLATIMLLGMFSIGALAETPLTLDMKAVEGASVRIGDVAGIRFQTMINKAELDAIVTANGASNVEIGTLITPTQYVKGAGAFTMAALDAYKELKGFENVAYVKVLASYENPFKTTEDGYYIYAGSLENILDDNVMLDFSGIGYVKVGDEVVYAEYNELISSRTVGYVAYRAYLANDENLGTNGKSLIDDFANKFLVAKLGSGAPDISTIRYFEAYDDMANTADFVDATTFLGWKDNFVYGSNGAGYVYGKDVKARYEDGKLIFQTTNTAREGHTSEYEFTISNTLGATSQDVAHSLLTIPGLDNTTLYAEGNDTFVMQFDMKITAFDGDCGVGIAYCDKDTNLSRGRFVAASDVSWMFCSEVANTTAWYKKPGSIAAYCDPDAAVVRVQFILNKDMTVQQMSLNGTVINATYANADQVSGNFDIGLYFLKVGTVEIDNLLVYSYNSASN